jgi:hypothetical protein
MSFDKSPTSNNTEASIAYINTTLADRRKNLLPQALTNQEKITEGKNLYQGYREGILTLKENPKNKQAQNKVHNLIHYLTPNGNANFRGIDRLIPIPNDIAHKSPTEITNAEQNIRSLETYACETIAVGYGVLTEAVSSNDLTTAITILNSFPDLVHHPEICQQLEELATRQLINNSDITTLIGSYLDVSITTTPFLTKLTQEGTDRTPKSGDISLVQNLLSQQMYGSEDQKLPKESVASITRINQLVELGVALSQQDKISSDTNYHDDYRQLNKLKAIVGYQIKDEALKTEVQNFFRTSHPEDTNFIPEEYMAAKISAFMTTESFDKLDPQARNLLQIHLLGHCLGLLNSAKYNTTDDTFYLDKRITALSKILSPLVTTEDLQPSLNEINDLNSFQTIVVQKIITSISDRSYRSGQLLKTNLQEAATNNTISTTSSTTETTPLSSEPESITPIETSIPIETAFDATPTETTPLREATIQNIEQIANTLLGLIPPDKKSGFMSKATTYETKIAILTQLQNSFPDISRENPLMLMINQLIVDMHKADAK